VSILNVFKQNKYKKLKKELLKDSKNINGIELSKERVSRLCKSQPEKCYRYKKIFFIIYKDIATSEAIPYAEDVLKHELDPEFIKVLAARYRKIGEVKKAKELLLDVSERDYAIEFLTLKSFSAIINECEDDKEVAEKINQLLEDFPDERDKVFNLTFSLLKDAKVDIAIEYGMQYFLSNPADNKFSNILLKRLTIEKHEEKIDFVLAVKKDIQYINKLKNGSLFHTADFSKGQYEKELAIVVKKVSTPALEYYIKQVVNKFKTSKTVVYKSTFIVLKDTNERLSLEYFLLYEDSEINFTKNEKIKEKNKNIVNLLESSEVLPLWAFKKNIYKKELEYFSIKLNKELLEGYIHNVINKFPKNIDVINKITFSVLKDSNTEIAVKYGLDFFENHNDDIAFIKPLIKRLERLKRNNDILEVAKKALLTIDDDDLNFIVIKNNLNSEVDQYFSTHDKFTVINELDDFLIKLENKYKNNLSDLYRVLYGKISTIDYKLALLYANKALEIKYNEYVIKDIYDLHIRYGELTEAYKSIPKDVQMPTLVTKMSNVESFLDLYENGFDLNIVDCSQNYIPNKNKVLYLLHNSLPHNSGGYATRTHGLLTGAASYGWNMHGVSRLGYPWDKMPEKESIIRHDIDGIAYHRLSKEGVGLGKLPLKQYLEEYALELLEFARKEKPEIIHAASNYMNGCVGSYVAKCLGIKFVYEVRGLWEITRVSRQPGWKDTEYYNLMVKMESEAAKGADKVLTLTQALKDEMISRGVEAGKISLLPNGVTSNRFTPRERNSDLEEKLNFKNKIVIGYIGSVVEYEGLELLVEAIKILVDKSINNMHVLIVGDGAVLGFIKNAVQENQLEEYFTFTGRIPHDEVEEYYSLVDIAPFPRKGQPVCEMVSPLKPFEAMAMEKAVISSNVNALAEIIKDGFNGLLFQKDNFSDLSIKLEKLILDDELRSKLGKQSREWVLEYRDWGVISKILNDTYNEITGEDKLSN